MKKLVSILNTYGPILGILLGIYSVIESISDIYFYAQADTIVKGVVLSTGGNHASHPVDIEYRSHTGEYKVFSERFSNYEPLPQEGDSIEVKYNAEYPDFVYTNTNVPVYNNTTGFLLGFMCVLMSFFARKQLKKDRETSAKS